MQEAIAIIGLAGRFPGAENAAAFWRLLLAGGDAVTEVPPERWAANDFYAADPAAPGKMASRWGGFLKDIDQFDPEFFGLSPREAQGMDPQHRLLVETAWEAFEDAGLPPAQFAGQPVGVFVGQHSRDYNLEAWADINRLSAYTGTGTGFNFASNRLSYLFDFRGPSLTLDTACSSALVALHLACQSLQTEEASLALVGAVNLVFSPAGGVVLTKSQLQSPSGHGRPFDARADGYVRSEGVGFLLLKPLAAAQADGDSIYAVVRGTAVNQDGRTNGMFAPNRWAQEAVLRSAYRRAGVAPGQVQYVEAQGTGTLLGDAIELKALGAVLAEGRDPAQPCAVGSVKTNIGHCEAASGMASLIKVALALKHGQLPPSLHFEQPNPNIPFDSLPLRVHSTLSPWPAGEGLALAGVSAFGIGGTNAHVVLEAASPPPAPAAARPWHVLALSARRPADLRTLAGRLAEFLAGEPTVDLNALCYTANAGRAVFAHRLAAQGSTAAELAARLAAFARGETPEGVLAAQAPRRPASPDTVRHEPPLGHSLAVWQALANALAAGFLAGQAVEWRAWHGRARKLPLLPTYPFQRQRYWLDPLAPRAASVIDARPAAGIFEAVAAAAPAERPALLQAYLREQFARVLPAEALDGEHSLLEAGLDSIMALEAVWQIERDLRLKLEAVTVFEQPTLRELAGLLAQRLAGPPSPASDKAASSPAAEAASGLSFAQQRFWFLEQLTAGEPLFNVNVIALRLSGPLDTAALEQAINEMARRQASLRTTFPAVDGLPSQVVAAPQPLPLPVLEAAGDSAAAREAEARRRATEFIRRPFDLEVGPLWRAALVRLAPDDQLLLIPMHHIISDGWSVGVLFKELSAHYRAAVAGTSASLPEPEFQYADFARRQQADLTAAALADDLAYWRDRLAGELPVLELPTDRPRLGSPSLAGAVRYFSLPPKLAPALRALSQREGVTLFMTLLAAFYALLHRYTGQTDLIVGSPTTGRDSATRDLIGVFINALALRTEVTSAMTFQALLARVRAVTLGALAHQNMPFEKLVEALQPERDRARPPIFQSLFIWQNMPLPSLDLPGLHAARYELETSAAGNDLTLMLWDLDEVVGEIEYKTDLFDSATIERFISHWLTLLESIVSDPSLAIAELPLLTRTEQQQLVTWNATQAPFAAGAGIHELISAQARRTPGALAVVMEDQTLTYQALEEQANRLAHALRRLGVGPESRVGLCVERSPDMLVGLLGILKAGGAYVPLDPSYPADRLAFMLADADLSALVTEAVSGRRLPPTSVPVLRLDAAWGANEGEGAAPPLSGATAANSAYLIYTSGSTGLPKGVVVEHRGLVNYSEAAARHYALGPGDRVLQFASLSWDTSAEEIFPALASGATLVLRTPWVLEPASFVRACGEWGVTVLILATAYWHDLTRQIAVEGLVLPETVRLVVFGGEPAMPERLAEWRGHVDARVRLVNTYGATEATAVSTWCDLAPEAADSGPIPIGQPLPNVQAHVLNDHLRPAPIGVTGWLYVGGAGLARGYWNQPALTAEKFIPRPAWLGGAEAGERLYATGDLARWRPDGRLECLGRADAQLKIRGFRVELGEIEAALQQHPDVLENAVLGQPGSGGATRLIAYVAAEAPLTSRALQDFLGARLPEFMLPAGFVFVPALPRLPGGKLDRAALSRLAGVSSAAPGEFVPPRDGVEEAVAEVWRSVLQLETVGVHDNFFELGGHSLLATQVVSRLRQDLRADVSLRQLFDGPTIAELATAVRAASAGMALAPAPLPGPRPETLPLSFAQERMWFLHHVDPQAPTYNVSTSNWIDVPLDFAVLAAAVAEEARRHETLRTTFHSIDGQAVQRIHPESRLAPVLIDLRGEADPRAAAIRQASLEARRAFDLETGPLVRLVLYQVAEHSYLGFIGLHHIISDNWTLTVLAREVFELYMAFSQGRPSPLPEPTWQYADYALWQHEQFSVEKLASLRAHWLAQLAGAPLTLSLPGDHSRPARQAVEGHRVIAPMSPALHSALTALSQQERASLFMTLLAAFNVVLYRYTGQADLLVGVPVANRTSTAVEHLTGVLVNMLVMRTRLGDQMTFRELLAQVRETALDAYAHQDMPFEKLVDALQPRRDLSRSPVLQVMFNMPNAPLGAMIGQSAQMAELDWNPALLDLNLTIFDHEGLCVAVLMYSVALFERATIERLLAHFIAALEAAVANPDQSIAAMPLLAAAERQRLLVEWNDTCRPYPLDDSIQHVFETQVDRTPQATAIIGGDERLTLAELNARANRLARHLQAAGVRPGDRVGVAVPRSAETITALLAVLKTGAAYVALDPAYPGERLAYMLADSGARVLITQPALLGRFEQPPERVICLEAEANAIAGYSAENLGVATAAAGAAYIVYTSGSTGRPKAVVAPQRGVLNRLHWMWEAFPFVEGEVVAQKTSLNFVDSVAEIFGPLLRGVPLAIIADEAVADPALFVEALTASGVTRLTLVPALLRVLLDTQHHLAERLPRLALWVTSGEALTAELCARFKRQLPAATLLNLYGSSEVAGDVTFFDTRQPVPDLGVPIGRPIANTQMYVLDDQLQPAPLGAAGELYVGGAGLALGYLNQPELTAERFVAAPAALGLDAGARLYRTGDLARYLLDGNLLWLGRVDHQVKVRGMRVELEEVQAVLNAQAEIAECVVVAREDDGVGVQLVAYAAPRAGAAPALDDLRRHLAERLPAHMLPAMFVLLPALPHTASGKIDRAALPPPEAAPRLAEFVAPRTPAERALAPIWAEQLGLEAVSIRDNFFELGGHSLMAMELFARIKAALGRELPVSALFQAPTIEKLAALLDAPDGQAADQPLAPTSLVAIQPRGEKLPFYCVHPWGGGVADYGGLAAHLGLDQPFYGLRAKGVDDPAWQDQTLEALAADYIREIQAVQPAGPYHVGGYSSGGLIAFEMARQLLAGGQLVGLVALLDSYAPALNDRQRLSPEAMLNLLQTLPHWLEDFARLGSEKMLARVRRKLRQQKAGEAPKLANVVDGDLSHIPARHLEFIEAHYRAILAYRPQPYAGPVTLFRAQAQALSRAADPDKGWRSLALGGVDIREFAGSHHTMLTEPYVASLAEQLERKLAELRAA